ncbi:DUF6957 family protein [Pseudomonas fluorescens]|uniref:DUF6957 family protein n=1 Tax=Pseudomonas fluorescens TaxID=294 RepID=UPI003F79C09E
MNFRARSSFADPPGGSTNSGNLGQHRISVNKLAHSDALALVRFYFPGRAYCLVADWTVVDIVVSPRQLKAVAKRGVTPTLVNALCVIHDSKGRFPRGHWVRTSLGVSFTHDCLFETKNTVYVLMGPGRRVRTDLDVAQSLY